MYVCMYVYVYVCMYECMYMRMYEYLQVLTPSLSLVIMVFRPREGSCLLMTYEYMYAYVCMYVYISIYVYMQYVCICMYVCKKMYVLTYVCMFPGVFSASSRPLLIT